MKLLEESRNFCEKHFPGSVSAIYENKVDTSRPHAVADHLRQSGLPAAVVPERNGGRGLTATDSLRLVTGIGAASASTAVAFAMHGFSVATVASLDDSKASAILDRVASDKLLMCSAFSEGGHRQSLRRPKISAACQEDGSWLINGSKKPCSLAADCDIVTAGISLSSEKASDKSGMAFAVFDRGRKGISTRPFWGGDVLQGAGSDELVLENVRVEDSEVYPLEESTAGSERLDLLGTAWFTLMLIGGYAGVGLAAVEQLDQMGRGAPAVRAASLTAAAGDIETVLLAAESAAATIDRSIGYRDVYRLLQIRYALERMLGRHRQELTTLAGGSEFIRPSTLTTRLRSTQALQFHPPFWRDQYTEFNQFQKEGETFDFL